VTDNKERVDSEAFYSLRDDRTLRLVGKNDYRNKAVLIAIDDELQTLNGQTILLSSSNLIARFCRNIDVICDESIDTIHISPKFYRKKVADTTMKMLKSIDPYGNFRIVKKPRAEYDAVLAVGTPSSGVSPDVWINSNGWIAYISKTEIELPNGRKKQNPIGAGAAACFGTGEIFKHLLDIKDKNRYIEKVTFSSLDYSMNCADFLNPDLPEDIRLGNVQMVGAGAIGSGVVFFLCMLPITGSLTLIDNENIDVSNLNRYMIATLDDVNMPKIKVATEYLGHHQIEIASYQCRYNEYTRNEGAGNFDVVLPLVDNNEARHQVQMNMPLLTIYGTTGEWAFTIGRHKALEYDCLICRYPNLESIDESCGTATVSERTEKGSLEEHIAAVSFVSALAGVLTAGELIKRSIIGYPFTKNFFQADMFTSPVYARHIQRNRKTECICGKSWFREAFRQRIQEIESARYPTFLPKESRRR
jgi:molybdopterin/thiamine biosynthesis adenylyltransferase